MALLTFPTLIEPIYGDEIDLGLSCRSVNPGYAQIASQRCIYDSEGAHGQQVILPLVQWPLTACSTMSTGI